jgi:carboxyl-terminal processing protease
MTTAADRHPQRSALRHAWPVRGATFALAALLCACGGGDGGNVPPASGGGECELAAQKTWLRSYMADWYFWSGRSPDPDPLPFTSLQSYFDALRFTGDGAVPRDRWSYISDTAAYNQFFAEGKTLGYGLSVNGIERQLPLRVRYVEALSPAARAGLQRGDVVVSLNGRGAADLVAANDFSALSPAAAGDTLSVVVDRAGSTITVALTAEVITLTPVPVARVLDLAGGRKAGYVVLKDFIPQAEAGLATAFAQFRAAGATELVIDLRYNGGGRISVAATLASLVAGGAHDGKVFTTLKYNAQRQSANVNYPFAPAAGPAFTRALVLTGPRTCSASELLVNGLTPHMQVVTVGSTSCGKPFGFNPVASCGSTYSAVNFEAVNSNQTGRYYDGLVPTCAATDTFEQDLGAPAESLTSAALGYLNTGACAAVPAAQRKHALATLAVVPGTGEPGEFRGMVGD